MRLQGKRSISKAQIIFILCAVGIGCSNLVTFIIIAIRGIATVCEPNSWILYTEMATCMSFIVLGIYLLIKSTRKERA